MDYYELSPVQELKLKVLNYWLFTTDQEQRPVQHTVPPDGCVSICFYRNERLKHKAVVIVMPSTQSIQTTVLPGSQFFGIRVFPGKSRLFIKTPLINLRNRPTHMHSSLIHPTVLNLADRCFDKPMNVEPMNDLLMALVGRHQQTEHERAIEEAVMMLMMSAGNTRLSENIDQLNIHPKTFQRLFKKSVGITAKEFARICRIRSVILDVILDRKERDNAIKDRGYFDRSHFEHEIKQESGRTGDQFTQYLEGINHHGVKHYRDLLIGQ